MSRRLERLADWWDKFASTEVSSIEGISGRQTRESADHVAAALEAWHRAGADAGDLAFWRGQAEQFRSPKAYALVVDALLEQRDPVAAMALLVQWLSQVGRNPAGRGELFLPRSGAGLDGGVVERGGQRRRKSSPPRGRPLGAVAEVPRLPRGQRRGVLAGAAVRAGPEEIPEAADGGPARKKRKTARSPATPTTLFGAAYEDMTYRDSTDDGFEGEMLEGGAGPQRLRTGRGGRADLRPADVPGHAGPVVEDGRRGLLGSGAAGRTTATRCWPPGWPRPRPTASRCWNCSPRSIATAFRRRASTQESLVEFDRRRGVKEMLLEQIIAAAVETGDAGRLIRAVMSQPPPLEELEPGSGRWKRRSARCCAATRRPCARAGAKLIVALARQPLLYVALARGGNPQRIVASRSLQGMLRRLLGYLPRLGLLRETAQLIETIQQMESGHPVGPGAITEFDQMFKIGCKAIVRSLVLSAERWRAPKAGDRRTAATPN